MAHRESSLSNGNMLPIGNGSKPKNIRVVCLGDSTTAYIQSVIQECSDADNWTNILSKQLNIEVINAGISGDSSAMLLARVQTDVIDKKPQYCIIEEGGNDTYNSIPPTTTISNIIKIVDLCRKNGIIPLIMPCNPQFNCAKFYEVHQVSPVINWEDADKLPTVRRLEKEYCDKTGVTYIDAYTPFLLSETSQDLSYYCQYDQVHPSVKGYQKIAEIVSEELKKQIGGA